MLNRLLLTDVQAIGSQSRGLLGLALELLLVFGANTSYDRWWEARKLWGQLVNDSRNLAIKVAARVRADAQDKHQLAQRVKSPAASAQTPPQNLECRAAAADSRPSVPDDQAPRRSGWQSKRGHRHLP